MGATSRRLLQTLLTAVTAASASTARADGGYVLPGFLATPTWGHVPARAWGVEVSAMYYESHQATMGVGAFAQAQSYVGDTPTHGRYAAGIQAGWLLGGELGVAFRRGAGGYADTTGVQLGPYVSIGFLTLGARFVVPVMHGARGESYGFEGGLDLAFKVPVPWGEPPPDVSFGHGRPLRVAGATRQSPLTSSMGWC